MTTSEAEEIPEFALLAAEAVGDIVALEAARRLLRVALVPVADRPAQHAADRPHVAVLAQHGADQVAVSIDRPVEVGPAAATFRQVSSTCQLAPGPRRKPGRRLRSVSHVTGSSFAFQFPNGLVTKVDPAQRHDLAQVAGRQPVAEPAEHHERDDVAGQAGAVQHAAAALVTSASRRPPDPSLA